MSRLNAKRPNAKATEGQVDWMPRRLNAKGPNAKANEGQADFRPSGNEGQVDFMPSGNERQVDFYYVFTLCFGNSQDLL